MPTAQIYTRVSVGRMMKTYNAAHPHARFPHVGRWKRRPRIMAEEELPLVCHHPGEAPGARGNAGPSSYRCVY